MFKDSTQAAIDRITEEQIYEQIALELQANDIRSGLWTKAFAQAGGDEKKAKSLYISYRYQSLLDELAITRAANASEAKSKADRAESEVTARRLREKETKKERGRKIVELESSIGRSGRRIVRCGVNQWSIQTADGPIVLSSFEELQKYADTYT